MAQSYVFTDGFHRRRGILSGRGRSFFDIAELPTLAERGPGLSRTAGIKAAFALDLQPSCKQVWLQASRAGIVSHSQARPGLMAVRRNRQHNHIGKPVRLLALPAAELGRPWSESPLWMHRSALSCGS
jgi:hypothetical protein